MTAKGKEEFSIYRFEATNMARIQAEEKYSDYKPKGAIKGTFDKKPNPDMIYDYNISYWVPKTAFKEKRDLIDKEIIHIVNATPDPDNPGYTFGGDKIEEEKISQEESKSVQPEQQDTGTPTTPKEDVRKENKAASKPKLKRPFKSLNEVVTQTETEPTTTTEPLVSPGKIETHTESQPEAVEQSKKTRRSAKMVESDFVSLAAQFICHADVGEKKPLFFPERIRESLRKIAGLVPGGKVSPSHIAIHVIEAWIDEHRDLFNRMFTNQKTSI